jgi:GNAT superfamily N-acetyltransferase
MRHVACAAVPRPVVRPVPLEQTRALRQAVLRPHLTIEELAGHEPAGSFAAGAFEGEELVAVGLVGREGDPGAWRVRGMATAPHARGRGAGTAVLDALVRHAAGHGATSVWCNARTRAIPLYERAGFSVVSDVFEPPDIGPHVRMERRAFQGFGPEVFEWFAGLERDNSKAYFTATRELYEHAVRGGLEAMLDELSAALGGEARVFRQQRDLRFAPDKTPYKTRTYGVIHGAGRSLRTTPRGYPHEHPRIELLRRKALIAGGALAGAGGIGREAGLDHVAGTWHAAEPLNAWLDEHVGPSALPREPRGRRR